MGECVFLAGRASSDWMKFIQAPIKKYIVERIKSTHEKGYHINKTFYMYKETTFKEVYGTGTAGQSLHAHDKPRPVTRFCVIRCSGKKGTTIVE